MLSILAETPLYVWPLFLLLLWGGIKTLKTHRVSWKEIAVMPIVMLLWSFYAMYGRLSIWALAIAAGIALGRLTIRRLILQFDRKRNLLQVSGDVWPLILSMTIFSLRYGIGVFDALHPESSDGFIRLAAELAATVVSGMFLGRLAGYWKRSRSLPHVDLA